MFIPETRNVNEPIRSTNDNLDFIRSWSAARL